MAIFRNPTPFSTVCYGTPVRVMLSSTICAYTSTNVRRGGPALQVEVKSESAWRRLKAEPNPACRVQTRQQEVECGSENWRTTSAACTLQHRHPLPTAIFDVQDVQVLPNSKRYLAAADESVRYRVALVRGDSYDGSVDLAREGHRIRGVGRRGLALDEQYVPLQSVGIANLDSGRAVESAPDDEGLALLRLRLERRRARDRGRCVEPCAGNQRILCRGQRRERLARNTDGERVVAALVAPAAGRIR